MRSDTLNASLRRLRGRLLAIEAARAACWGFLAALALLAVWAWMDLVWELGPALRAAARYVVLAAGLLLGLRLAAAALRHARHAALARRLDASLHTGGQILSGHDLDHQPAPLSDANQPAGPAGQPANDRAGITAGLAQMAVRRAAQLAAAAPAAVAVPARPLAWAATAVVAVLLAIGLVAVTAPRLASTQWLRFTDPYGDHPPYSRTLLSVEPGDTRVVYGEGLDVIVSTEGPAPDEVEIVMLHGGPRRNANRTEEVLPMFPETGGKWRASIAEIRAGGTYYARAHATRSHRYDIHVITVPQIRQVRWRVTPPAYTHEGAYEGPMPQGGLAALSGARVEVWAKSNRPLSGGAIEIAYQQQRRQVSLASKGGDEVSGTFIIRRSGKFSLNVTDAAGQKATQPFRGTITLLKDTRPFVRLVEPPAQSLATPTATLPVVLAAEDDYGLARCQLFRGLNDSRPLALDLPLESTHQRRAQHSSYLPLSAYGLEPGDVIKLFARVEDNDPAGAKGSESAVAVVQIISDQDYQQLVRAREGMQVLLAKYQQAERRMESLAEQVRGLQKKQRDQPSTPESDEEHRQALKRLASQMRSDAEAIRKAAEQLLPYDLDKSLTRELQQQAEKLERLANEAEQLASQGDLSDEQKAKRLSELLSELDQQRQQFQREVTQPLGQLAELYPLLEDEARFTELARRQRDLAQRMAALKGKDQLDDPALKVRMRDLEDEQRRIREDLGQLLDDIENHASRLPDDPELADLVASALEFADAVRSSGASEAMTRAQTGLAEFAGTTAHAAAGEAADILESFLSKCQSMGGQAQSACRGLKFAPGDGGKGGLGDTLSQLLADAGLGNANGQANGQGMGQGGQGGGYSARRDTLNNMGLYGNLPTRGGPNQSGGGQGQLAQGGAGQGGWTLRRGQPGTLNQPSASRASGLSEVAVPIRYRGRVRQYFERIADETSP